MRRSLRLVALAALAMAVWAPAALSAAAPARSDITIAGGADKTSFAFQLINNHIYADVRVNGQGPFLFIFDTGAVNVVTPEMAKALGLRIESWTQGIGVGAGHVRAGLTGASSLTLGAATLDNPAFAVLPLGAMSAVEGVAQTGMVGFETFRRFVTRIDYGTRTITLIRPDAFDPAEAGTALPIRFNGKTIEVDAAYDGIAGRFMVDTGSRAALILNAPFVAEHGLRDKAGKGVDAVIGWGVGGPSRAFVSRGTVLKLGGYAIDGPVVAMSTARHGIFAEPALAGNIGGGLLKRFVVTLDYAHLRLYLKPVAGPIADLDLYDRAGLWLNEADEGFVVAAVTKGAPADTAGLRAGDLITAVDGRPAGDIRLYDLRRRLREDPPGTIIHVTVRRGHAARTMTITLEDLIAPA